VTLARGHARQCDRSCRCAGPNVTALVAQTRSAIEELRQQAAAARVHRGTTQELVEAADVVLMQLQKSLAVHARAVAATASAAGAQSATEDPTQSSEVVPASDADTAAGPGPGSQRLASQRLGQSLAAHEHHLQERLVPAATKLLQATQRATRKVRKLAQPSGMSRCGRVAGVQPASSRHVSSLLDGREVGATAIHAGECRDAGLAHA
jgi:hypothetical protein